MQFAVVMFGRVALVVLALATCGCWSEDPLSPYKGNQGSGGGNSSNNGAAATSGNGSSTSSATTASGGPYMMAPGGYYTSGNRIYTENGTDHVFRGMARPSLEWNYKGENLSPGDYQNMASWGANVVRIALNQGFWLQGSVAYAPGYKDTIDQNIQWAEDAGMAVILDLHWSDKGDLGIWPEQQAMADQNSVTFWKDVAARYKDDGQVLFELYNEPKNINWNIWKSGGQVDGFMAAGMQDLYDAVRSTGAENLVIIGGTRWAYDLSGVVGHRINGYNIVYATHLYNYGDKQPAVWQKDWLFLSDTDPVIITEFGDHQSCSTSYSEKVIDAIVKRDLSFTAWAWYPGGCEFPALIEDWAGTPTANGQLVKNLLSQ